MKVQSQFTSTELKEQKPTHVQGGNAKKPNDVLLKKSLPGRYESLNNGPYDQMPVENRPHKECEEPEKKVGGKSHVGDGGNSLESDLCVNSQQQKKFLHHILRF